MCCPFLNQFWGSPGFQEIPIYVRYLSNKEIHSPLLSIERVIKMKTAFISRLFNPRSEKSITMESSKISEATTAEITPSETHDLNCHCLNWWNLNFLLDVWI